METNLRPQYRPSSISRALKVIDSGELIPIASVVQPLEVRAINGAEEMDAVYRLIHDSFLERGYCQPQLNGKLIHCPHLDNIPETVVIGAWENDALVGTNSVTVDGPRGLHVDKDFKDECDAIRAEGRVVGASWRLGTDHTLRGETRVVMGLIEETILTTFRMGIQTSVFTFNPRHENIYKRMLNMTTVAFRENMSGLTAAPAVLMRLDVEKLPERWLENPRIKEHLARPVAV